MCIWLIINTIIISYLRYVYNDPKIRKYVQDYEYSQIPMLIGKMIPLAEIENYQPKIWAV